MVHHLNIDLKAKAMKQKRRNFTPERNMAVMEDFQKLIQVVLIREVQNLEWLANFIMVKKANRK